MSKINSGTIVGLEGQLVEVEAQKNGGQEGLWFVGMTEAAAKDARMRVRSAMAEHGFERGFGRLSGSYSVNITPTGARGVALLDLPIALALVGVETDAFVVGELGLQGDVRCVRGVLPLAMMAKARGFTKMLVPEGNGGEAAMVEGLEVYTVRNLRDAVEKGWSLVSRTPFAPTFRGDLEVIKGQLRGKRALEVAAAGWHNLLICGAQGTGKTMLANRLASILPPLTFEQALEVTTAHSVAGTLGPRDGAISQRPFRAPHYTISEKGLIGEIALARHGVLYLDELGEFRRSVVEGVAPLIEKGQVRLIASTNTVTPRVAEMSKALRFDMMVELDANHVGPNGEPSEVVRTRVAAACQCRAGSLSGPATEMVDGAGWPSGAVGVAVTIASLRGGQSVSAEDMAEALSYRVTQPALVG